MRSAWRTPSYALQCLFRARARVEVHDLPLMTAQRQSRTRELRLAATHTTAAQVFGSSVTCGTAGRGAATHGATVDCILALHPLSTSQLPYRCAAPANCTTRQPINPPPQPPPHPSPKGCSMHPAGRRTGLPGGAQDAECPPICRVHSGLLIPISHILLQISMATWSRCGRTQRAHRDRARSTSRSAHALRGACARLPRRPRKWRAAR